MDEQKNQQNQQTANVNVPDYTSEINAMYDAQRQQQLKSLEDAYNQNTQTLQSARADIAPTYNRQANDLNAQYERSRMNNNMQAAANGINTGVGSQMALAQQSNYLDAFGNIRAQQARAEQDLDQQLANLEINYKNSVSQAIANNDHERAAALMAEYKRRDEAAKEQQRYNDNWNLNKAQTLAQYGNFSGYAELYGQDVANAMQQYYDMMTGGSVGSSGRSSGSSYRGSGSSGNGGSGNGSEGPGKFPNAANQNSGMTTYEAPSGSENGAVNAWDNTLLLAMQANGGSEERALQSILQKNAQQAQHSAMQEAIRQGYIPGTSQFNSFVDRVASADLRSNIDYLTAQSALNELNADKEGRKQKKASEAEKAKIQAANSKAIDDFWYAWMHPGENIKTGLGIPNSSQKTTTTAQNKTASKPSTKSTGKSGTTGSSKKSANNRNQFSVK